MSYERKNTENGKGEADQDEVGEVGRQRHGTGFLERVWAVVDLKMKVPGLRMDAETEEHLDQLKEDLKNPHP